MCYLVRCGMRESNRSAHLNITFILAAFLLAVLTACGGPSSPKQPDPTRVRTIAGKISLPTGHGVNLASLTVSGANGTAPVSANGEFTINVFGGAAVEIGVETAAGRLLLLGVTDSDDETRAGSDSIDISLASTANSLLYYLVGGMWLPREQQDKVRSLLTGAPAAARLATELERQLLAGGNGVADPDDGVLAALQAAHGDVLGAAGVAGLAPAIPPSLVASPGSEPQALFDFELIVPAAVEGDNIVIEPSAAQAGVKVLHNPAGSGVVAQNSYRRPAALLAYEVAWEDADRAKHPTNPPVLVGRVEVPATGQLEFFNALLDVVTGASPWSPVLSTPLALVGHDGASRTHYQLILIGPSTANAAWPIMSDERFTGFHDAWDEIVVEKSVELFLDDLLLPLIEVYGLGSMAKLDAAKLNKARERVRIIHDKHLAQLGVYLTQGQAGYGNALRFLMAELIENRTYRLDMLNVVKDALDESTKNKATIDAMEKRLSSRAGATAVAAAVQGALVSGDIAKIMHDLASSPSVIDWTAVSAPALFALSPASAIVSRNQSSARFTVIPKGSTSGNYLYRWATSGVHGEIDDLLQSGTTFTTSSREVWYFHDSPNGIEDSDRDTVTVEIFEVEEGAVSIPAGASPIARMAAEVRGDDRFLDPRLEVTYGSTHPDRHMDGLSFPCAEMNLRFKAEEGATSYTIYLRGVGGQGDVRNGNQDFRLRGPNHTVVIDPNAKFVGGSAEPGWVNDYYGLCNWRAPGDPTLMAASPPWLVAFFDRGKNEYLVTLFAFANWGRVDNPSPVEPRVALWYDWVEHAQFEVVVKR